MKNGYLIAVFAVLAFLVACSQQPKDECQKLQGQTNIDQCYFERAVENANIQDCQKITLEPVKEVCISEIAEALNDVSLCKDLEEKSQGNCYTKIAMKTNDSSLCKSITSVYWWDICYNNLAVAKLDENLCAALQSAEEVPECYNKVAFSKSDTEVCKLIDKPTLKNQCIVDIALATKNVSVCAEVGSLITKDGKCYFILAQRTNSSEVCNLIKTDIIKEECIKRFS